MRTYQEALAYLNQFINYERTQPQRYAPETLSLDRVNRLLERLGRPDRAYHSIHIAGTKGKGSTAAMIESCLRAAGYRTGFYTSPHLHTFRERMRVDNDYISREDFAQLVDELEPQLQAVEGVTWFEITTTLAFMFYARSQIDVAVLEVGLGGRFDATNVVTPLVAVITSLSMDHMNLLGDRHYQAARAGGQRAAGSGGAGCDPARGARERCEAGNRIPVHPRDSGRGPAPALAGSASAN
jgi:dihydrofolate synthase/folylpolyglutamate synthase